MDIDTLDLNKLRVFHLVAIHGSLRGAASRLGVTESAVSLSIRRFEEELGLTLFQRLPNKLVLTKAGAHVADSAKAIFEEVAKVLAESATKVTPNGEISLSVNNDLAWYTIPKVSEFLDRYTDIELKVFVNQPNDTMALVESGKVNIGIGRFHQLPKSLETKPVIESTISLVCLPGHSLTRTKAPKLEEIARYKLITLRGRHSARLMIDETFTNAGIKAHYIEGGNCHAISEIVETGIGVGLIHTFCIRRNMSGSLRYIDLSRCFGSVTFSAIYRKEPRVSPEILKMMTEFIKN